MKDYALYYSYKGIGDVLIVMFDDIPATRSEDKGRVTVIYNEDKIIGYNVFDVKDIVKIKSEGMIYLPSPALVDVINTMLNNAHVEPLDYVTHSGYYTAQVVDANKEETKLSLKDEIVLAPSADLKVNDKVVVAVKGTHLSSGKIIKDKCAHICTYKELGINIEEDKILVLDEDVEIGKDFFSSEVR